MTLCNKHKYQEVVVAVLKAVQIALYSKYFLKNQILSPNK